MKRVVTFLMLLLVTNTALAQSKKIMPGINAQHRDALSQLLSNNERSSATCRTTAMYDTLQHVIAQSTRDSTTGITDSVHLSYLPSYRSQYDYNYMIYPYNYPYNTTPLFNFKGYYSKPLVLYDTFKHWAIDPLTLAFGYYESRYAGYDAYKNITSLRQLYTDSTIDQNMNYTNTFNTLNNVTNCYRFNEVLGASDSAFKQYFLYNTSNRLIEDSVYEWHGGSWHIVSKTYYTYNPLGDLVQIDCFANDTDTTFSPVFPEQTRYVCQFDASHRLKNVVTSLYNGTALQLFAKDTFGYTSFYTFHTFWVEWEYDLINGYWTPYTLMTKQLNTAALPDTFYTSTWDSVMNAWVPQSQNSVHYNSYNNPDTLREYDYNFTYYPAIPSYKTVYYYDTVLIPTGNKETEIPTFSVVIYPNPAKGVLNFRFPASGHTLIKIIDITGRLIAQQLIINAANAMFDVHNYPKGTYIYEVSALGKVQTGKVVIE